MKALASFGEGLHAALLEIARPSLARYARCHGYHLLTPEAGYLRQLASNTTRPASWLKIPFFDALLQHYDTVFWIDADCILMGCPPDVTEDIPEPCWQALVVHHTSFGYVPSCGVWLLRKPMRDFLPRIWAQEQWIQHPWWEQRALIDLLGWGDSRTCNQGELYRRSCWLDQRWNAMPWLNPHPSPFLWHASAMSNRAEVMRRWAAESESLLC